MKRLLIPLLVLLLVIGTVVPAAAESDIDSTQPASLTVWLHYGTPPQNISSAAVYIWKIADVSGRASGITYTPVQKFEYVIRTHQIDFSELKDASDWRYLARELAAAIDEDAIVRDAANRTGRDGRVVFDTFVNGDPLTPGLYLVRVSSADYIVEPALVLVPQVPDDALQPDGSLKPGWDWDYDAVVQPKPTPIIPPPDTETIPIPPPPPPPPPDTETIPTPPPPPDTVPTPLPPETETTPNPPPPPETETTPPESETTPPDETLPPIFPPDEPVPYEPVPEEPTPDEPIPKTGLLWWPVPVLGVGGLACVVVGLALRKKGEDND